MTNWPQGSSRGARGIVLLMAGLWFLLGAGDWFLRFYWFRWHHGMIVKSATPFNAPFRPMLQVTNAPSRGGDLSKLLGIPGAAARFEEDRPRSVLVTDEFGFQNRPPAREHDYAIAVTGDSYMLAGPGTDASFPSQLAAVSGLPVYNYAYAGRGSFWGLLRLLLSDRFKGQLPGTIVWGLIEREIAGSYFVGVRAQLLYFDRVKAQEPGRRRFNRYELTPRRLRASLPNSSACAQASARLWNRVRYAVLGIMNPSVVPAADNRGGAPMLFYAPAVDAMRWTDEVRDLGRVTDIIGLLDAMARERGSRLVVVLIPDKERVYEDLIPEPQRNRPRPLRPSVLPDLEQRLRAEGIAVVSLLPSFMEARARGVKLYWNDDTHWHPDGIRIAAEETWRTINGLVSPRQE